MNYYKILNKQEFSNKEFSIVPIRFQDRLDIMKWRNEQLFHLRQNKLLTVEDQENYFNDVVSFLFEKEKPEQMLFSFLDQDKCVGYGGLVHINWVDKNAEISFIMNTELEKENFSKYWSAYLGLIECVAFNELGLHKIYTYAFDLRPHLYDTVENEGYKKEAVLKEHCLFQGMFKDVVIHSKINILKLRRTTLTDLEITYQWASNSEIRKFSFNKNPIFRDEHTNWFNNKLHAEDCCFLILENILGTPLGSIRVDLKNSKGTISYLVDPVYQGNGYGKLILQLLEDYISENSLSIASLEGLVMRENKASERIFEALKYKRLEEGHTLKFVKELK